MTVDGCLGNRQIVGVNCMEYMLPGANCVGYDLLIPIKFFFIQRNTLPRLDQYSLVFNLCILCDVDPARINTAAMGAFGTTIADKGGFHEQRAAFIRFDKSVLVYCGMLPDFSGNSGWIFTNPLGYGLECHSLAKTFLNLNTILKCHVLVFLGVLHCLVPPFPRLNATTFFFPD